jgi:uncharacterized protein YbjT (DUF2867 family)
MNQSQHILLTGVTGFIGGSLLPRLLEAGYPVRVLVRNPAKLQGRAWLDQVEVVVGDVFQPESLEAAMRGVDVAYYFVHSLYAGHDFHELDMTAARNFAQAAEKAGVKRIIYLGGLGEPGDELSPHLRSRQETGQALLGSSVPATEFRAAIIIGSGSGSFEMIRYLAERIPPMICPRWVFSQIQPISIGNVLDYLVAALGVPASTGEIIEIGGADVLSYADTMLGYARARGLWRVIIPVPVLTPSLSSHWVGWVTPVSARLARPLIEGLRNDVVVTDDKAARLFPNIQLMAYQPAVELALQALTPDHFDLDWIDAQATCEGDPPEPVRITQEGMFIERRYCIVDVPAEAAYSVFTGLGGQRGWLYANWAWQLRGLFNRLLGGFKYQRTRRDPEGLQIGDEVDFLRVERLEPGRMLRLGDGGIRLGQFWLQFEAQPLGPERTRLVQTTFFAPKGLTGLIYWAVFRRLHRMVFSRLIDELEVECQSCQDLSFD